MNVLAVDVGGTHVKVLLTGEGEPRKFSSGPALTAKEMVEGVKKVTGDWKYDAVSIGFPGPVLRNRPVAEPRNLGSGWVGFNFRSAIGCQVKLVNDAAMQGLGSYRRGKMLFLGLGTGLGSALIVDGIVEPMELGHLPYKRGTYESYLGNQALVEQGKKKWRRNVTDVVARLIAAIEPDEVVLGGGNVKELDELPPKCRAGDNRNAFEGGFRLWAQEHETHSPIQTGLILNDQRTKMTKDVAVRTATAADNPAPGLQVWRELETHFEKIKDLHLRQLFADDPKRGERLSAEALGLHLDYSKNRITDETLSLLIKLAHVSGLQERIDAMFRGEKINLTEKRAVLHTALRAPRDFSILVDGENVVPKVHAVLDRMADFANRVRSGEWKGHTGKRIRNVINVGIGGSDLGPVMAYEALKYYADRTMTFRFVSNVDATDFAEAVVDLDPAETLFIISSKTFTTLETMTNAQTARDWCVA